ncbi:MAG: hypothetical protein GY754_37445 [bacterium]|nr:hypothetical protein [bacterium]
MRHAIYILILLAALFAACEDDSSGSITLNFGDIAASQGKAGTVPVDVSAIHIAVYATTVSTTVPLKTEVLSAATESVTYTVPSGQIQVTVWSADAAGAANYYGSTTLNVVPGDNPVTVTMSPFVFSLSNSGEVFSWLAIPGATLYELQNDFLGDANFVTNYTGSSNSHDMVSYVQGNFRVRAISTVFNLTSGWSTSLTH